MNLKKTAIILSVIFMLVLGGWLVYVGIDTGCVKSVVKGWVIHKFGENCTCHIIPDLIIISILFGLWWAYTRKDWPVPFVIGIIFTAMAIGCVFGENILLVRIVYIVAFLIIGAIIYFYLRPKM